jgi:hypothetical protein
MNKTTTLTNSTFQTTIEDTTYNGWTNYETWNVALWIENDEGLYNLARGYRHHGYKSLSHMLIELTPTTPDGVKWDDVNLNLVELDEMMEEL